LTIVQFPGGEKTETPSDTIAEDDKASIDKCLELATQRDLAEVFIIGRKNDGDVWFSTNEGDIGNMLFLLETAKAILIKEALGG
jgi:hypothetical protein